MARSQVLFYINCDLCVEVRLDLVVTMPGTSLRIVYRKPRWGSQPGEAHASGVSGSCPKGGERQGPRVGLDLIKGRRPKPTPLRAMKTNDKAYIFFSAHVLVAASHTPPALAQSAAVLAAVTSWAKAGAAKASARAIANMEIRVFMSVLPYAVLN